MGAIDGAFVLAIGVILGLQKGYIGIMENEMETTI